MNKKETLLTIERMNDTICELKAANIELSKQIAVHVKHIESKQAEIDRLRKLYNEQEDELVELKEEYRSACDNNRAHLIQVGRLQSDIKELRENLEVKDEVLKDSDTQRNHFYTVNQQMAEEIDMLKNGMADLLKTNEARTAHIQAIEKKLGERNATISDLEERLEYAMHRGAEAIKTNGHLATKSNAARQELEIVGYKNSERLHREEIERQQHMIDHLRSELDVERKNHVHTQNLSSMAKNRADDCERYKQFYFLLRELVGRKENT